MIIDEIKLNQSQIQKMKHTIGLDRPVRREPYKIYRNFYASDDDTEWNEIVDMGLAEKKDDPFNKETKVYHLTMQGIKYLARITGIQLTF